MRGHGGCAWRATGRALLGLVVAVVPWIASELHAQTPPDSGGRAGAAAPAPLLSGVVTGRVLDSLGLPVAGAQVSVAGLLVRANTTEDGSFKIAGVHTGPRIIRARRIGFRPDSARVEILPGGEIEVELRLNASVQQIAPLVVEAGRPHYTGRMAAFFQRRDRGFGHFFTAEEIDRRNPRVVTDLLRTLPGVRLEAVRGEEIVYFRGQRCEPLVWVDGAPATAGYLSPDYFAPNTLAGIEVYPGVATVPQELMWMRGKGACGVIALWTRLDDPPGKAPKRRVTAQELANLVAGLRLYTADQVDQPAFPDTAEPVSPIYPDSLLRRGLEGRVLAEFVVDSAGKAEMETFGVVFSTDRLFTDAVRRAVARARFVPAVMDGKAVRQLMQVPISFVTAAAVEAGVGPGDTGGEGGGGATAVPVPAVGGQHLE